MATLREIRTRIVGVKNTAKITSAMKMVAAAKMRRAQDRTLSSRPYATKLSEMISLLAAALDDSYASPLLTPREEIRAIAVVVVAADRGLCGAFNANVLKLAHNHLAQLRATYPGAEINVICVGKKSVDYFNKTSHKVIARYPGIFNNMTFVDAKNISQLATSLFVDGAVDMVQIISSHFKSTVRQEPVVTDFLPIPRTSAGEGKTESKGSEYIFEPSREAVLSSLLPKHLNMQVWKSLLDSFAGEQAARMMAMENATTNAKQLMNDLQLKYNKARQAAITTEILEIVSGAEALKAQ